MPPSYQATLVTLFLSLAIGCSRPATRRQVHQAASAKNNTIVIDVFQGAATRHEAQTGQVLEWRASGPNAPEFWIQFSKPSPCEGGAFSLHGTPSLPARCTAALPDERTGTVTYSYEILLTAPTSGPIPDRAIRCPGCTN